MPSKLPADVEKDAKEYCNDVLEKFYKEFFVVYSQLLLEHLEKNDDKLKSRKLLPHGSLPKDKIIFTIPGYDIVDQECAKDAFITYTVKAYDGKTVCTTHRRYDQFKHLHKSIHKYIKHVSFPEKSSGAFGVNKQVSDEFAQCRIPQLKKYLNDCVEVNTNSKIKDLSTFFFGENTSKDRVVQPLDSFVRAAFVRAFERISNLSPVMYDDVGEALTKYIAKSFSGGLEYMKEPVNMNNLKTYFQRIISLLNPAIELKIFEITNEVKSVRAGGSSLKSKEKIEKNISDTINESFGNLVNDNANKALDEFINRLQKLFVETAKDFDRAYAVVNGFVQCRYPEMAMITGISTAFTDAFNKFNEKCEEIFSEDFESDSPADVIFSIFPSLMKAATRSFKIERILYIVFRIVHLRL